MIKHLTSNRIIGQGHIVRSLNNEIDCANYAISKGEKFYFRPKLMAGPAGTGKGTIVEAFAEVCFAGEQYKVFPPKGGIGDFKELQGAINSVDEDLVTPIPAVVFYDEFHDTNNIIENIVKLLINKHVGTCHRTGALYHHNQSIEAHKIFFASNEIVDKAIASRCETYETAYYTPAEIEKHVKTFLKKDISQEGFDYVISRLKPIGRDIQAVVEKLDKQPADKLTIEHARDVVGANGFGLNPGGIERKDMKLMKRLCEGAATLDVLKWAVGDQLKKQTKERADWLQHLDYIAPAAHSGFALTKKGAKYYDETMEKLKAQKAAKANKAASAKKVGK